MNFKNMKQKFWSWMQGDVDVMEHILDGSEEPDLTRKEQKQQEKDAGERLKESLYTRPVSE